VIPLEVLGNIYEQYLGYTIRLTPQMVKYELKPEVRKAGGVYYTPEYIVDYIVKNTVGKILKESTGSSLRGCQRQSPKQSPFKKIKNLRILDPACGSGSFLIRAYEEMLNYYKEQKKKDKPRMDTDKHGNVGQGFSLANSSTRENVGQGFSLADSESKPKGSPYEDTIQKELDLKHSDTEIRLSIQEKAEILKNHIFGVDIDEQAVEVTKLSLMLKMLEGEFGIIPGRNILPMLDKNIRCGNSLISGSSMELKKYFGDDYYKVKPFNWEEEFKEIMSSGGFDVVIGNPPYGAELSTVQRKYLEDYYKLHSTDTACLFMALAIELLKDNGMNSFIIPKPFTYSSNWENIRKKLLNGLIEIVDCSKVWKEVKLEQVIYLYKKNTKSNSYRSCVRKHQSIEYLGNIDKKTFREFGFYLNGISHKELLIGKKIRNVGAFLNDFVTNQRGAIYQEYISEKQSDYNVLGGKQIGRYFIGEEVKGYILRNVINDDKAFIKTNSILVQNIVAHIENPIDHIKIIASLSKTLKVQKYIIVDTINQLQNISNISSEFLIAILNSKLISWYIYRFVFGKAIRTMHFDNYVTERIPIPKIDLSNPKEKKFHDNLVALVDVMLDLNKKIQSAKGNAKDQIQREIDKTDKEIDNIVYKLYGITEEERKVVEYIQNF
jgi:type II restriction/modification system DNA methylase subunit YeeA